ncbi:MAG: hypothetical protein VYA67_17670 [Actinomycetota bacterium]|uniref:Uncharacterized protein n=1 Tax=Mycobacterium lentiflavum TaxID=141349 RepID=A0ABY3ULZ2_MYCLN|nr:hypothetical protein [Mycobacterium lentiflavum]MEE3065748.1 hypothetical protein [Actinomycetota bacterium]ULP40625.1 hypothetical protein MJO58_16765 [Mycobacterium lentiflavum]
MATGCSAARPWLPELEPIPSISSRGGTDDEGNYVTLLANDSEGNAVVFSEYDNY